MFKITDLIVPNDKEIKQIASVRRPSFDRANSIIVGNSVDVAVCFIGDSITESFELNAYFHDLGIVINRGIGFDTLKHTNVRLEADLLQLKPRVGVFMCGVNDNGPIWRKQMEGKKLTQEDFEENFKNYKEQYDEIFAKCYKQSEVAHSEKHKKQYVAITGEVRMFSYYALFYSSITIRRVRKCLKR